MKDVLPKRKTLRFPGYDYSRSGAYFVTICTHRKKCTLAEIRGRQVYLTQRGRIVLEEWNELPSRLAGLVLDAFVVMPNHIHGLLVFVGEPTSNLPAAGAAEGLASARPSRFGSALHDRSLSRVIGSFKSLSTIAVNRRFRTPGAQLWQRGYYEHIARTGEGVQKIQRYILENPAMWSADPENPDVIAPGLLPVL